MHEFVDNHLETLGQLVDGDKHNLTLTIDAGEENQPYIKAVGVD